MTEILMSDLQPGQKFVYTLTKGSGEKVLRMITIISSTPDETEFYSLDGMTYTRPTADLIEALNDEGAKRFWDWRWS